MMTDKKSIKYEIGFADSIILSYYSHNDNSIISLKCWNHKILNIEFINCVLFLILNSWNISDICESNNPILLEKALKNVYEIIPKEYPYKLFQFLDNDDDPVVEIVCENIIITAQH